jgi:hypothetical protein
MPSWAIYGNERRRGISVANGAYDPSTDAGMVVWYKADDEAAGPRATVDGGYATDGGNVNQWQDSGPGGKDLIKIGGDNLTMNYNILNGLPGVTSDAAGSPILRSVNDAISLNSAVLSVFILVKNLTGGDVSGIFIGLFGSAQASAFDNTSSMAIGQPGGTNELFYTYGNNGHIGQTADSALAFGTPAVIGVTLDGPGTGVGTRYLNGVSQGTPTAWTTAIGNTVLEYLTMFGQSDGNINSECTIYEAFVTTTNLTNDIAAVQQYFENKWGNL